MSLRTALVFVPWLLVVGCATTAPPSELAAVEDAATESRLEQRATQLMSMAAAAEPAVTKRLVALAEQADAELFKLEFRLKTKSSLLRKMRKEVGKKPGVDIATMDVGDTLRYTMKIPDSPPGHHVETTNAVLDRLEDDGHRVTRVKNYWPRGDNYSGINCNLLTPDGLRWELQFQTPESIDNNKHTRSMYEELREVSTPVERKRELFDAMAETWDGIDIPKDVLIERNLHPTEEIIVRDRP